jgi:hypothetical protein
MAGFELEAVRNASIWTVAGAVLLALVAVWVVKQVVTKVLTVAILLAIAALVWSQRAELTDCADRVQLTIDQGLAPDTTCTFFGREVTVPGRTTLLGPGGTPLPTTTPETAATPTTTTTPPA